MRCIRAIVIKLIKAMPIYREILTNVSTASSLSTRMSLFMPTKK